MANFICRNRAGTVIATFPETDVISDIRRCTQLVLENENLESLNVSARKTGASAQLTGRWLDSAKSVLESNEAAPEVFQNVVFDTFPDRYAHSVVHQTYIQRADFVLGIIEQMDYDDQTRFIQRLFRDTAASVRALVGDVLDLQTRLGETMQRLDNLENYIKTGDTNFHNLPGSTNIDNPVVAPLPNPPYYIGKELISNEEEQLYYHQGYTVAGIDGGLRRYFSAQESRGIDAPPISPFAVADENTGILERFDQGALAPDGGPACSKGEVRNGYGINASCSDSGDATVSYPEPIVPVIPIITTAFYKPQYYSTGIAVIPGVYQSIYPISSDLISGIGDEIYYNVANPLCTDTIPPPLVPKCLFPAIQPNPFLPMPEFPIDTGRCTPQNGPIPPIAPCGTPDIEL